MARPYAVRWGFDLDDLLGEMSIAFLEALRRFDPGRGNRLLTYATWWFLNFLESYVTAHLMGSVNMTLTNRETAALRAIRSTGITDIAVIREQQRMVARTVENALKAHFMREVPLEMRHADGSAVLDLLAHDGARADDELVEAETARTHRAALKRALANLSKRARAILMERMSPDPRTLEEIGQAHGGLSRQRVNQIVNRALWQVTNWVCATLNVSVPADAWQPPKRRIYCTHCEVNGHERRRCPKLMDADGLPRSSRRRRRRAVSMAVAA